MRLVNTALIRAIKSNATEVRLEPVDSSNFLILHRIREDWLELDRLFLYALVNQRLKQMADIVIERITEGCSQSGIINVKTGDVHFIINLNTEPTEQNERIVLHINKEAIAQ